MRYKILPFISLRKNTAFNYTRRYISNWSSYEYNCLFHLMKCFTLSLADFANYFPRYCSVMNWKFKVKLYVIINAFAAIVFSNDIQTWRYRATMSRGNFNSMAILYFSTNLRRYGTIPVLISMFIPHCTCIFERFIKYITI